MKRVEFRLGHAPVPGAGRPSGSGNWTRFGDLADIEVVSPPEAIPSTSLATKTPGAENPIDMSNRPDAKPIHGAPLAPVSRSVDSIDAGGPQLRLAGTTACPLTPAVRRLLELRAELVQARAVILEDAGFIRRRLERSGRADAISCITGEDAFDGASGRIDHEIARVDLELARIEGSGPRIEIEDGIADRLRPGG